MTVLYYKMYSFWLQMHLQFYCILPQLAKSFCENDRIVLAVHARWIRCHAVKVLFQLLHPSLSAMRVTSIKHTQTERNPDVCSNALHDEITYSRLDEPCPVN